MSQGKETNPDWLKLIPDALESGEVQKLFSHADLSEREQFLLRLNQSREALTSLHIRLAGAEPKAQQTPSFDWATFSSRPEKGLVLNFRKGKYLVLPYDGHLPRPAQRLYEKYSRHIAIYGNESVAHLGLSDRQMMVTLGVWVMGESDYEKRAANTISELRDLLYNTHGHLYLRKATSGYYGAILRKPILVKLSDWEQITEEENRPGLTGGSQIGL